MLIIKGVLDKRESESEFNSLLEYLFENGVYPPKENDNNVLEIYWSKAQLEVRQHEHVLTAQKALLKLWKSESESVDLNRPLTYIDRLRIGGSPRFQLPPHVDGGGIERWKDPDYRNVYKEILAGRPERFDPFNGADSRCKAQMSDVEGAPNACTFFRAFQVTPLNATGPFFRTKLGVFTKLTHRILEPCGPTKRLALYING